MTLPEETLGEERRKRLELLRSYLEKRYKIRITGFNRLDRGVYKIDKADGRSWVVRIFSTTRPLERAQGDEDFLRYLEENNFPAERCAGSDPVSSPGGRSVLITEFIEGVQPEKNEEILKIYGELLGRLTTFTDGSGEVVREAGALHHYSPLEGRPRNEINSAISWLDAVEDRAKNMILHKSLLEQLNGAEDCQGLPQALIHPDPVLKNLLVTPREYLLIDWTGAGRGPRLASLAVLIWAGAIENRGWSAQFVDALVSGYRKYVALEPEELDRLAGAMMTRQLVFAAWRYRRAIDSGKFPEGSEWWWPSEGLTKAIAGRARYAFERKPENKTLARSSSESG